MHDIKKRYFQHRISQTRNDNMRSLLGLREAETLKTVYESYFREKSISNKLILDVGCGDRHIENGLCSYNCKYWGIDIYDCNFENGRFPHERDMFDITISYSVLEHLVDPSKYLSEIVRVTKPGGFIFIETPDIAICGFNFWDDPTHVRPYNRASISNLLCMAGLRNIKVTPNFRCKPKKYYNGSGLRFFQAKYFMPFKSLTRYQVPSLFKGKCQGLFAFGCK